MGGILPIRLGEILYEGWGDSTCRIVGNFTRGLGEFYLQDCWTFYLRVGGILPAGLREILPSLFRENLPAGLGIISFTTGTLTMTLPAISSCSGVPCCAGSRGLSVDVCTESYSTPSVGVYTPSVVPPATSGNTRVNTP